VEGVKTCTFDYCTLQNYVPISVPFRLQYFQDYYTDRYNRFDKIMPVGVNFKAFGATTGHLFKYNNLRRFTMSGVDINLHRVKNVIVQKHTHDYENGERWFVTKDIIVVDNNGDEILKLSLFGDDFDDLRFQSQAEFDGLIESTVSKIK
jgi:hypothetical protein